MSQIECRDLALGYNGRSVSEHVSFSVDRGDYLCIVGENGSGKSTLMKAILGLKSPDSGEVIFGDGIRSGDIGYLPQQTENGRDFPASVSEVVLSGYTGRTALRPFFTKKEKANARENMKKMGVETLEKASFSELSGGQRQRVLLARALCAADKILLLDEPVAGLDPAAAADMYSVISRLNSESDITVIMITHDIGAALKYSTAILHMGATPLLFSSPEEYRKSAVFAAEKNASEEEREND